MKLRTALIVLKNIHAFCIVFFCQFAGLGLWASESDSLLEKSAVSEISDENPVLTFSHSRNYYREAFYLSLSATPTSTIIFTTDCSKPTMNNGSVYSGPILIDSTTIIRAIAFFGTNTSEMVTNSYLFVSDVKKQSKNPSGFPVVWSGSKTIPADYEMDPEVINDPEYVSAIDSAFSELPSLSLTMDINSWFNPDTGMYVGYPNSDISRAKAVTAEFIFQEDTEESFAVSCGVQNQGGTSIVNWKSPKQSMRLLFKEMYGPTKLKYKLFPDSEINSINTLVVDAMLNSTWIHPTDEDQRFHALYLHDQLTSDLQNDMGGLSFHGMYFHLYLNGLYWGICNLHERPDDAFLAEHLDAKREDFDVIKHNPNTVVAGTNSFYTTMLTSARNGFSEVRQLSDFEKYLDIPAFIDYMLLNFYLGNYDWAHQNFYAGRDRTTTDGFRFYPWDSELVMRFADVNYDNTGKNNEGGPTEIHSLLKENEEYRMMFADAVYKHLFNDGALTPENFRKRFLFRKSEIENAIILESARWGDYRKDVSGTTYTKKDFWIQEVNRILDDYIPKRRDIVIGQLRKSSNNLFPKYLPPEIEANTLEDGEIEITLNSQHESLGEVYFTLDGTDPRNVGGGVNGTAYSDKIIVGNTSLLKARFYSVADKTWSALAEEMFVFDDVYGKDIIINEIMYHPDDGYPEFIEIMNFGDNPVNLRGFRFSGGINYMFRTDENINPGAGLVLTNDNVLFSRVYKFSAFGQFQKNLSNSGEAIYLTNRFDQLVDSVAYSDTTPWPELADGDGYSLELINPDLDNALWSSWRASEKIKGSPYSTKSLEEMDAFIYPNPFMSEIFIEFGDEYLAQESFTLEVFNQLGVKIKVIRIESFNAQVGISLASLPSGLYFFRLIPDKKSIFKSQMLKAVKLK
ncbi:T9SS type A sorting domain-containing protein [Maribellus comscasis]|uniref:T9SS type A sorting domain-containing protein n=1 Tax=Maribellus comscasis TaxID=2681766 RepID=A0A6I6K364_9BACT|nr:CotH kinase family protein [Maribellus comscasis]QGY46013.1 T9SS type A sorting domain-containing protein [Maribellus comscasis]